MIDKAMVEGILYTNPLPLLAIKDKQVIDELNSLIPYSTGFEIECDYGENYNVESFKAIPDIMNVQNDSREQRYRIPNGLRGIICLYYISLQLKINSLLNPLSSVHYHVDCTDCFKDIYKLIYEETNTEYILSELDTWLEKDTAVNRQIGCWFKLNDLKTVEFRLGEMTFDYPILLKRIIHCNRIVKKFKDKLGTCAIPEYIVPDTKKILNYNKSLVITSTSIAAKLSFKLNTINAELDKINKLENPITPQDTLPIRNRVHRIE